MNIVYTSSYQKQRCLVDSKTVAKLEQAIEVHGYRGASKKRNNGIVPIRPTDKELWKSLGRFSEGVGFEGMRIADIKIVAHVTNGTRIVSKMYREKNEEEENEKIVIYLLGFWNNG